MKKKYFTAIHRIQHKKCKKDVVKVISFTAFRRIENSLLNSCVCVWAGWVGGWVGMWLGMVLGVWLGWGLIVFLGACDCMGVGVRVCAWVRKEREREIKCVGWCKSVCVCVMWLLKNHYGVQPSHLGYRGLHGLFVHSVQIHKQYRRNY